MQQYSYIHFFNSCMSQHENIVRIVTLFDRDEVSLVTVSAKGRVCIYHHLSLNLTNSFMLRLSAATESRQRQQRQQQQPQQQSTSTCSKSLHNTKVQPCFFFFFFFFQLLSFLCMHGLHSSVSAGTLLSVAQQKTIFFPPMQLVKRQARTHI